MTDSQKLETLVVHMSQVIDDESIAAIRHWMTFLAETDHFKPLRLLVFAVDKDQFVPDALEDGMVPRIIEQEVLQRVCLQRPQLHLRVACPHFQFDSHRYPDSIAEVSQETSDPWMPFLQPDLPCSDSSVYYHCVSTQPVVDRLNVDDPAG